MQESLTNVIKHAEARRAEISIQTEPDQLMIMVTDDGHGGSSSNGGHGLAGLQERARLLGGQLTAGPGPDGGFSRTRPVSVARREIESMIDVLVVDDQELVRSAFAILLRSAPGLRVVGEAADGDEAVRLARQLKPRVVLMDIRMPRTDGLQATARIAQDPRCADVRVLILTTFDQDDLVHAALRAGASGFLLKDTPPAQLLTAIQVVADGEALLAPTDHPPADRTLRRLCRPSTTDGAILEVLTERERDVLAAVAEGRSNAEIAELLYMGYGTVKTHVSHLLTKLGARDRAQLVVLAYESGLVGAGPQVGLTRLGRLYLGSAQRETSARGPRSPSRERGDRANGARPSPRSSHVPNPTAHREPDLRRPQLRAWRWADRAGLPARRAGPVMSALIPVTSVDDHDLHGVPARPAQGDVGRASGCSARAPLVAGGHRGPVVVLWRIAYGVALVLGVAELTIPPGSCRLGLGERRRLRDQPAGRRHRDHGRGDRLARLPAPPAADGAEPSPAAVLTGFIHGLFHLPLILLTTVYDNIGSRWVIAPMVGAW